MLNYFRNGCVDFMKKLAEHKIPLLIFSAGIGNVIEELLKQKRLLLDNVRIVSNFMNFNDDVCSYSLSFLTILFGIKTGDN